MLQYEVRNGNPVAAIIVRDGQTVAAMCCNATNKMEVTARLMAYAIEKGLVVARSPRT